MKIKLLLLFCMFTVLASAQAPITNYFSSPLSQYAIVSGTIDQMPTGANATWNFGTLTQSGTNTDTYAAPTAAELASYPGTTDVLTISDGTTSSNVFYTLSGGTLNLTGISNSDFTLNYVTNPAFIGDFPLTFGTTPTSMSTAGNITSMGFTESFTGTIDVDVNAHGMLSFDVTGQGTYSGAVTRVNTSQAISFTLFGTFPGTVTINTNNYYKDADGALVFRTTDGVIEAPPIITSQTFSSAEALITNTLAVDDDVLTINAINLYPNPVEAVLNIQINNSTSINSVSITDLNGRSVLASKGNNNSINVSQLESGLYLVTVSTEAGRITKKFIKN